MGRPPLMVLLLLMTVALSGCDLVGDVLEFGFWTVTILVVLLVALLIWVFKRLF